MNICFAKVKKSELWNSTQNVRKKKIITKWKLILKQTNIRKLMLFSFTKIEIKTYHFKLLLYVCTIFDNNKNTYSIYFKMVLQCLTIEIKRIFLKFKEENETFKSVSFHLSFFLSLFQLSSFFFFLSSRQHLQSMVSSST